MTKKGIPKLENETKLDATTNLSSFDRMRFVRLVQTASYPRICLHNDKATKFIEVINDSVLDEVISNLMELAEKLKK